MAWLWGLVIFLALIAPATAQPLGVYAVAFVIAFFIVIIQKSKKAQNKVLDEKNEKQNELLRQEPLTPIKPHQALIKANETAFAQIMCGIYELKTVGYKAGSRGASVRIAKGFTVRTSGTRASPIKDMVCISNGELVITDQRLIFAGDLKSFSMPIPTIINVTEYSNGVGISDEKKTYTLIAQDKTKVSAFQIKLDKVLNRG